MPLDKYCFNLSTGQWAKSYDDPSPAPAPVFGHGDNRDFGVTFLRSLTSGTVEVILGVTAAQIGLANGATLLTSATASSAVNNEHPFVLSISSAGITTLMTGATGAQKVNAVFKLTTANGTNRYLTFAFISPQIVTDTTADPAIAEPATTMSEVRGAFIPKERPAGLTETYVDYITGETLIARVENRQLVLRPLDA